MSHPISDKGRTKERFLATKRYNTTYKYEQANATGELTLRYTGKQCSSNGTAPSPTCCCDNIIDAQNLLKVMLVFVRFQSTTSSSFLDVLSLSCQAFAARTPGRSAATFSASRKNNSTSTSRSSVRAYVLGTCDCCSV